MAGWRAHDCAGIGSNRHAWATLLLDKSVASLLNGVFPRPRSVDRDATSSKASRARRNWTALQARRIALRRKHGSLSFGGWTRTTGAGRLVPHATPFQNQPCGADAIDCVEVDGAANASSELGRWSTGPVALQRTNARRGWLKALPADSWPAVEDTPAIVPQGKADKRAPDVRAKLRLPKRRNLARRLRRFLAKRSRCGAAFGADFGTKCAKSLEAGVGRGGRLLSASNAGPTSSRNLRSWRYDVLQGRVLPASGGP